MPISGALKRCVVVAALAAGMLVAASSSPALADSDDTLPAGYYLAAGDELTADNNFELRMQDDGNLVAYDGDIRAPFSPAIWASGTEGHPGAELDMQDDGNAVIYSAAGAPLWWSGTNGAGPTAHLTLQSDGNLVIYAGSSAVWATGLPADKPMSPSTDVLLAGHRLSTSNQPGNDAMSSPSGSYQLQFNSNSIRLTQQRQFGPSTAQVLSAQLWSQSWAGDYGTATLALQGDGNLVLYGPAGALWSSGTGGSGPGARLVLQDDGNLVLYSASGRALWFVRGGNVLLLGGAALSAGQQLQTGQAYPSSLIMQTDGNLVYYVANRVVWNTGTKIAGSRAVMQADGNFVLYTPDNRVLWQSGSRCAVGSVPLCFLHLSPTTSDPVARNLAAHRSLSGGIAVAAINVPAGFQGISTPTFSARWVIFDNGDSITPN